ncbi:MAG: hypothetical protein U1E27_13075, partial [Kiritimatiellia bacterium]|nr:hypothetical protein [Kiritimatiellia bacterium]
NGESPGCAPGPDPSLAPKDPAAGNGMRLHPGGQNGIIRAGEPVESSPFRTHDDRMNGNMQEPSSGNPSAASRVAAHARDALVGKLRPAEGVIPCRWSESFEVPGCVDTNETFFLVFAWRRSDPALARDLVRAALAGEQPGGLLPRRFRADGRVVDSGTPWPLLLQAARLAYQADPAEGREFLHSALPTLFRTLTCALDLFDPGNRGRPLWPSGEESYFPEIWSEGLQTIDLPSFLLAEIDAALALALEMDPSETLPRRSLEDARQRMAALLEQEGLDPATGVFRDRLSDGSQGMRMTLSGFFPLLWPSLHSRHRDALHRQLFADGGLLTHTGLAAWEAWPDDPHPPPVRASDQILLLAALEKEEGEDSARRLRDAVARRTDSEDDPIECCLQTALQEPSSGEPRELPWWERQWKRTAFVGIALFVILVTGVLVWASSHRGMPASSVEALSGLARNRYLSGDFAEAERLYRDVLDGSREAPPLLHLYYANVLFRQGHFAEAETHYRLALRGEVGENPKVQFNLAQCLYRLDKIEEARVILYHIVDEYADYPEVVHSARLSLAFLAQREKKESDARQGGQGGEPMR